MTQGVSLTMAETLPPARSVLVVCAHPDDESFGLGAAVASFVESGSSASVVCFTRGEASTLGAQGADLGLVRARELSGAAHELGVSQVELLGYRDGQLADASMDELSQHVHQALQRVEADLVLVFDEGGITGHPDHRRATHAALVAARARDIPVLAWALAERVAHDLGREFGATFVGRRDDELDFLVTVNRTRQLLAISQHVSQAAENRVLARRLELQGSQEVLRWLSPPHLDS